MQPNSKTQIAVCRGLVGSALMRRLQISFPLAGEDRGEGTKTIVAVDPRYFRPTEVETLLGDPSKAKEKLGWTPKVTFDELVAEMVREDLKAAERDELVKTHGYSVLNCHE